MRTLVIGDIHGSYKGLLQVLERSNFNPEEDNLITLGDIADGWSEVPQCVEHLLNIRYRIDIRGNHDKWCQDWLEFGVANKDTWLSHGGEATKNAYEKANLSSNFDVERHREFFRKQINYYVDDDNIAYVHGGYVSMNGLGNDYSSEYYWDRSLWGVALSGEKSKGFPKKLKMYKEIFIGHTTTLNWGTHLPMNACNVWNVDTGAGWEGKLTIMDVKTKEYWQSDLTSELYPEEYEKRVLIG